MNVRFPIKFALAVVSFYSLVTLLFINHSGPIKVVPQPPIAEIDADQPALIVLQD